MIAAERFLIFFARACTRVAWCMLFNLNRKIEQPFLLRRNDIVLDDDFLFDTFFLR